MIRINLLPYREKEKKENLQRQIILIAGSLVLLLLILGSVYVYFIASIKSIENEIQDAEAKLVVLNKKVGDIERFKRDKKACRAEAGGDQIPGERPAVSRPDAG